MAAAAGWIVLVEWLARCVLVLLFGLSIWSIRVILEKRKYFFTLNGYSPEAERLQQLWRERVQSAGAVSSAEVFESVDSPFSKIFADTESIRQPEAFEKVVSSAMLMQRKEWERGLPVLGTLGAIAPFIGLLGTVMGIIVSFGDLASGQSDSLKIMASLAEALILTAIGLAVAIPAVIANNYFTRKILDLSRRIEGLKELGIAIRVSRNGL